MQRIMYAGATILTLLALGAEPARAQVGNAPWCAVISLGTGTVYWDCQYWSVEACVPNVLAGNRGFCNHNPAFAAEYAPLRPRPYRHRKHRRHG